MNRKNGMTKRGRSRSRAERRPMTTRAQRHPRSPRRDSNFGALEVLPDGYGFVRSMLDDLQPSPHDVYVPRTIIERFELETGCDVRGAVVGAREPGGSPRMHQADDVNGLSPEEFRQRPVFQHLTSRQPRRRMHLEVAGDVSLRILDLFTPVGWGQRGLIVSPPRAGKTVLLQKIARSVLTNYPTCRLQVVLIDERPEEVTEIREAVEGERCEVVGSTFDQSPTNHARVAAISIGRAKQMVECGEDVVILLDSITRLTRAYNALAPSDCKLTTGGIAFEALRRAKEFFGAARSLKQPGSLTILATALIDTGTRMDTVIFEEFKGTGNLEIHLNRNLVERRIWPAIDLQASGTRREDLLLEQDELKRVWLLRKAIAELEPAAAVQTLADRLAETESNRAFLQAISV